MALVSTLRPMLLINLLIALLVGVKSVHLHPCIEGLSSQHILGSKVLLLQVLLLLIWESLAILSILHVLVH